MFWQPHLPVSTTEGQPAYPGSAGIWPLKWCACLYFRAKNTAVVVIVVVMVAVVVVLVAAIFTETVVHYTR